MWLSVQQDTTQHSARAPTHRALRRTRHAGWQDPVWDACLHGGLVGTADQRGQADGAGEPLGPSGCGAAGGGGRKQGARRAARVCARPPAQGRALLGRERGPPSCRTPRWAARLPRPRAADAVAAANAPPSTPPPPTLPRPCSSASSTSASPSPSPRRWRRCGVRLGLGTRWAGEAWEARLGSGAGASQHSSRLCLP